MDETKLISAWERSKLSGCAIMVSIDGLVIEGAEIDRGQLVPMGPTAPEVSLVPTLSLAYVASTHADPYSGTQSLSIPVYMAPSRESHLIDINMPSPGEVGEWVLSGCAFFLSAE